MIRDGKRRDGQEDGRANETMVLLSDDLLTLYRTTIECTDWMQEL